MNSFTKQKLIVKITWTLMIIPPLISLLLCYILYYYKYYMLSLILLFEPIHLLYYILLKYYINRYQNLSSLCYVRHTLTNEKRSIIWTKTVDAAHAYNFEKWYRAWFENKTMKTIKYQDAERFVSWVTFGVFTASSNDLKLYMDEIEKKTKLIKMKDNFNDDNHHHAVTIKRDISSSSLSLAATIPLLHNNELITNSYETNNITISSSSLSLIEISRKKKKPLYAPSLSKVASIYHPLWFYITKSCIQFWFENASLPKLGFKLFENDIIAGKLPAHQAGCKMFYRLPSQHLKDEKHERPILLFHGMGAGVTPYLVIISELVKRFPTRPIFVLYIPQISMTYRMELCPLSDIATLVEAAVLSLLKPDFSTEKIEVDILGHSLGTCVAVNVMQRDKIKCNTVVFADPAAVSCCLPDMITRLFFDDNYNGIFDLMVRSEIHTMYAVQRRLDWMEAFIGGLGAVDVESNKQVPIIDSSSVVTHVQKFTIFLSSRDMMIPFLSSGRIVKRLIPGAIIDVFEGSHGQWLGSTDSVSKFVSALE